MCILQIVHKKTASVLCLTTVKNEDKMEFSRILEAIKVVQTWDLIVHFLFTYSDSSIKLTVSVRFLPSIFSGQFQWQVWGKQEEVGWWYYGFQISSKNKGQRKTHCQGSCSKNDLEFLFALVIFRTLRLLLSYIFGGGFKQVKCAIFLSFC